ncbi:MAG: DEAD/DEAH box helicase [Candidatus Kerfeldbacteria bacterium]|nr:DEAD/DEAH box helicase [Candidatus Kerfeldbacteria bacterium]
MTTHHKTTTAPSGFYGLGLAPSLLGALDRLGFTVPTPIQQQAIPVAIEGKDVIGIAQTGTGKTIAFGLPMLQRLAQTKGRGLILLPTRELALQVDQALQEVGRRLGLRTAVLIGGEDIGKQIRSLERLPHVIVTTPGRLIDHLERGTVKLNDIKILVLDEADRMLDMGFAPQLKQILRAVPPPRERQTMLFSATMPDAIMHIASSNMKLPIRVEVARSGTPAELVTHEIFVVKKDAKERLLDKLLAQYRGSVLIFSRTKFGTKRLTHAVRNMGVSVTEIHSNRSQTQRREALAGFKSGKYRVLIATDIAARGIDISNIELVLNYDLPANPEDYVHRIGRTGRAGQTGRAISFAMPSEGAEVRSIEKLISLQLPLSKLPDLPPERPRPSFRQPAAYPRYRQPRSSGQRRPRYH